MTARQRVCVIGGGLAGLSAAVTCADAGAEVTLLEARGRLGGATYSFDRDGITIDNGQHVVMRCCTAYLGFLDRLGVRDKMRIQPRLSVPVVSPDGTSATLSRSWGRPPMHLAASLARYPFLSRTEKLAAAKAMYAMQRLDLADPELDQVTFGSWLRGHGQSEPAIAALWGLISIPTLNVTPDEASLAMAAMVFRTGLLDAADAADIGISSVPLSQLHADPAAAALAAAGATVRTSARVAAIRPVEDGFAVDTREDTVAADTVILATTHDVAGGLLPDGAGAERFAGLGQSPIVNLHVVYDRTVTEHRFLAGYQSPVQWIFDRTESSGVRSGQCLAVTLSAADDYLGEPVAALRERFVPAIAALLPAARTATVERFLVAREPHATFRAVPGTAAMRPAETTDTPGVFLAGSWTDTGWPATMEGAVRSGLRAARRALGTRMHSDQGDGPGNGRQQEKEDARL